MTDVTLTLPEIGSKWEAGRNLEIVTGHGELSGEPAVLYEIFQDGKRIGTGRAVISHWVESRVEHEQPTGP